MSARILKLTANNAWENRGNFSYLELSRFVLPFPLNALWDARVTDTIDFYEKGRILFLKGLPMGLLESLMAFVENKRSLLFVSKELSYFL